MAGIDAAVDRLRTLLNAARNRDGGWPYFAGRKSRLEPTAWALLALDDPDAAALLQRWRTPAGLLVEPGLSEPNYVFNAIAALALASSGSEPFAVLLGRTLLAHKGIKTGASPSIRQNNDLQGWAWIDETFSWIEPTAWCLLAVKKLARKSPEATARIDEAERLLQDRACTGGGWNYGNSQVFGKSLRAHVPPTAVGVLALQDRSNDILQQAIGFLTREALREGSTTALSLSWLALSSVKITEGSLVQPLVDRLPVTESVANLAAAAMMLYVLERHVRQIRPTALML